MHEFAEQLSEYTSTKYKLLTKAYFLSSCGVVDISIAIVSIAIVISIAIVNIAIIIIAIVNLPDGERHATLQLWVCCRAVVVIVVLVSSLVGGGHTD